MNFSRPGGTYAGLLVPVARNEKVWSALDWRGSAITDRFQAVAAYARLPLAASTGFTPPQCRIGPGSITGAGFNSGTFSPL